MTVAIAEERWTRAKRIALTDDQIKAALRRREVGATEVDQIVDLDRSDITQRIIDVLAEEERVAAGIDQLTEKRQTLLASFSKWFDEQSNRAAVAAVIRSSTKTHAADLDVAAASKEGAVVGLQELRALIADRRGLEPELGWPENVALMVFGFAILAFCAFLISVLVYLVRDGWHAVVSDITSAGSFAKGAGYAGITGLALAALIGIVSSFLKSPFDKDKARLEPSILSFAATAGDQILALRRESDLQRTVHTAAIERTDAALANEIAAHIRVFVDLKLTPSFQDKLPDVDFTDGLAEVLSAQNIVDTKKRDEVVNLMQTMPGGSIGIAGPRGAGKTTLISQIAQMDQLRSTEGSRRFNRKVLGVLTSAPVQYDGREFILHLFSRVCDRLLVPRPRGGDATPWERAFAPERRTEPGKYDRAIKSTLLRARDLSRYAAAALIAVSLAAAVIPKAPSAPAIIVINGVQTKMPVQNNPPVTSPFIAFLQQLGLQPLPIATAGFQLLIAAVLISRFVREAEPPVDRRRARNLEVENDQPRRRGIDSPDGTRSSAWDAVTTTAAEWDVELRYQQNFTSGWSGAVKLPIGFETGATGSTSLIARQLTFPELTKAFRDFVETLAPWFAVVIGIDELDKIATAEGVHQFVNEVKAIFGIRGVFFLVSVSDSAMSSFARRGLPVRDAFDSAFDEIVRIGYMDHEQAKGVLSRRVIGLSEPVVAFCECLSGGLPRDLIRVCRSLFTASEAVRSRKLGTIASYILRNDLIEKIDGSITHILDLGGGSIAGSVLLSMRILRRAVEARVDLQPACQSLIDIATSMATAAIAANDEIRRLIADTATDLAIYAVYCVTINDAVTLFPADAAWIGARDGGVFEIISGFRRALSLSSQSTNSEISEFRTKYQMSQLRLL